ncbi:MAG: hypothetical protein J6V11_00305 [Alphaproteobacteria bacterium]|nr:hypothetical protein [Alphaproteobacteria bacterium]
MKKIVLTVAALAMLGACSTSTNVDPWIGRSEDEVIARLGLPVRAYKSHDKKYMVYDLSQTNVSTHWLGMGNGIYTVSSCGYVAPVSGCGKTIVSTMGSAACQTVFVLDSGEVEDWTTTGRCGY